MIEVLSILRDLMLGGRHSRTTVARAARVSLPTADRWLKSLESTVPGIRRRRIGNVSWFEWHSPAPTPNGICGACERRREGGK